MTDLIKLTKILEKTKLNPTSIEKLIKYFEKIDDKLVISNFSILKNLNQKLLIYKY